jgi:4-hydroxy-tetrahydrodipicolinate reductase
MGSALATHLRTLDDIRLHATLEVDEDCGSLIAASCDVVLDLSVGGAVDDHGPLVVENGLPYIVGATGYRSETVQQMRKLAQRNSSPVLLVPNFSLGANLMIMAAAAAARLMDYPAITERHHDGKLDAPSGTARYTAERMGDARRRAGTDETRISTASGYAEQLNGVMGGNTDGGIAIHSLRGTGYLAEQAVSFCLPGESLTVEHRSIDRRCFMPGIVYAIRNIGKVQGLQIGLDSILEL